MRKIKTLIVILIAFVSTSCIYVQGVEYKIEDIDMVYITNQLKSDEYNNEVIVLTESGTKITTSKYIFDRVSDTNTIITSYNVNSDIINWDDTICMWSIYILCCVLLFIIIPSIKN